MSFSDFIRRERESILASVSAQVEAAVRADERRPLTTAFDCLARAVERVFHGSERAVAREQESGTFPCEGEVDSNILDLVAAAALRAYVSRDPDLASETGQFERPTSDEVLDLPGIGFELLYLLQLPMTSRTAKVTRSGITTVRQITSSRPPPAPPVDPSSSPVQHALIGRSEAMRKARAMIIQLTRRSRATVLLIGEAGTGKRSFAQQLHAATYPDGELLELGRAEQMSELTRRIATSQARNARLSGHGFTLYASNLLQLSAAIQAQLARWLDQGDLEMRLVVSLPQALASAVREGNVISQLSHKLGIQVELPPLRQRTEDLPELFEHFAELAARERAQPPLRVSALALGIMEQYEWPGNVSELSALIASFAQTTETNVIEAEALQELLLAQPQFRLPRSGINLSELEKNLLQQAMTIASNNQTRAASLLGLTRDQLRYRLAKFEIGGLVERTG